MWVGNRPSVRWWARYEVEAADCDGLSGVRDTSLAVSIDVMLRLGMQERGNQTLNNTEGSAPYIPSPRGHRTAPSRASRPCLASLRPVDSHHAVSANPDLTKHPILSAHPNNEPTFLLRNSGCRRAPWHGMASPSRMHPNLSISQTSWPSSSSKSKSKTSPSNHRIQTQHHRPGNDNPSPHHLPLDTSPLDQPTATRPNPHPQHAHQKNSTTIE
jgi:hypothetical protein